MKTSFFTTAVFAAFVISASSASAQVLSMGRKHLEQSRNRTESAESKRSSRTRTIAVLQPKIQPKIGQFTQAHSPGPPLMEIRKAIAINSTDGYVPVARSKSFKAEIKPSFYWEPATNLLRGIWGVPMRNSSGKILAKVSSKKKREAEIEGSLRISENQVLNIVGFRYAGKGKKRHRVDSIWTLSPYTHGAYTDRLRRFHDIAVDKRKIPVGSDVFFPILHNKPMPDKTICDGHFQAVDRGDFKGWRADIYIGAKKFQAYFERLGVRHMKPLLAIITPPAPRSVYVAKR